MGFEELPHTADCRFLAWGADRKSLFAQAAVGLNSVSGVHVDPDSRVRREISVPGEDDESLLVGFLSELVFFQEHESLAFDSFDLAFADASLSAKLGGARIGSISRPVKAVTFHEIQIRRTRRGLEVEVVLDV
jgi:SHS2 domain-containing protein